MYDLLNDVPISKMYYNIYLTINIYVMQCFIS